MRPLFILNSNVQFVWKPEDEVIRQSIISILTNEPVLMIFNPELPVELHSDASSIGYGAILFKELMISCLS